MRLRMRRGSPSKGVPSGVTTLQNMRATPLSTGRQGRVWKVVASGKASMSASSLRRKPSMQPPSKPMPSSKATASSLGVMAKDFIWPRASVNHSLMK